MCLATMTVATWVSPAFGQQPDRPRAETIGGGALEGLPLPTREPRPAEGPRGVYEFVRDLSPLESDAEFEVVLGRPRILTLQNPLGGENDVAQVAIGDPTIADFDVLSRRQLRIVGVRVGVTDLAIVTSDNESYVLRIKVVYDLDVLRAQLQAIFPGADIRLSQIREHVVVEGQARDTAEVTRILEVIRNYLTSMQATMTQQVTAQNQGGAPGEDPGFPGEGGAPGEDLAAEDGAALPPQDGSRPTYQAQFAAPQLVNLLTIPGTQQVMLKVRLAELNRTALRRIGFSYARGPGDTFFSQISLAAAADATIQGVFDAGQWSYFTTILRRNNVLKGIAEPTLMAMSGHQASFLAGGEFPVPVVSGANGQVQVQFREFGVRLGFIPFVMDHERIRMTVVPEVSQIDNATAVTLVAGGSPIPGLTTRRIHTTCEMRQGQTLALAGLLQLQQSAEKDSIPGIGDLPYIGTLFQDSSTNRSERELLVTVTPYLVEPMNQDQVPHMPGDDVFEPNDLEYYLLNRLESRVGRDHRSTTTADDSLDLVRIMKLEKRATSGKVGFPCE